MLSVAVFSVLNILCNIEKMDRREDFSMMLFLILNS